MENSTMGRVTVSAKVENLDDVVDLRRGNLTADKVRSVEVTDALVDSGSTGLLLPKSMIAALGLQPLNVQSARTISGPAKIQVYRAVRLSIQGRDCISDVGEIADGLPVIVGQIPLELMDWVVDMRGQKLIGNPEHGGLHIIEAFANINS